MGIKELVEQAKEHKYTKMAVEYYKQASQEIMVFYEKAMKYIKKARNYKYVVEAKERLDKLIKMIKQKIDELKAHPMTKKYTKMARKQFKRLQKEMKGIEK